MKKYEYQTHVLYAEDRKADEEVLNAFGKEGFELVTIVHIPRPTFEDVQLIGYFKKTVEVES
jgi:hypothetical protein